jgi:hypothetical protein
MRGVTKIQGHRAGGFAAALLWLLSGCGSGDRADTVIEGARKPAAVIDSSARAQREARSELGVAAEKQILFGDLHVHTTYSWDAFLGSLPLVGGEGAHPPADACDFARYCANLDFFALTDHAETLGLAHWQASQDSVRQCNALAGEASSPDLVAFMGFEWSQVGATPQTHFGHRCVVFRETTEEKLPARAIAARDPSGRLQKIARPMRLVRWVQPHDWGAYSRFIDYLDGMLARPWCDPDANTRELPPDCLEVAPTPADLNRKLDEWQADALVIPHGTAWGNYTPATADIAKHLDPEQFDPARQPLIEIMSGHGNSEEYRSWKELLFDEDGMPVCPKPTADYLPCCWQAGEIMRTRCGDLPEGKCEARVAEARRLAARSYKRPQQVFPDAAPEDWLDCDQCRDCFKPAYALRPRESVQYAMALSNHAATGPGGRPLRFRYGFVASSDNHTARPGTGYKQVERTAMTDGGTGLGPIASASLQWLQSPDDPQRPTAPRADPDGLVGVERISSFLYPGGLAAVHSRGRSREAIWEALRRREAYATSGPRILLWFDLLNGSGGRAPMGSEMVLGETPRFEVRAVGAFVQKPGCPTWSRKGLSPERLRRLCRDECHHPSDQRHRIVAVEVVRIRPQMAPGEPVELLIEDPWRQLECPGDPAGCVVTFEDPDFAQSGRDAVYYVRALQEETPAINGSPLSTEFDAAGNAVATRVCYGPGTEHGCPAQVRERAWSSPIFVNQPGRVDRGS